VKVIKKYFWNILVSLDQLANTLLGGDPDMTVSGRVGTWYKNTFLNRTLDDVFGKNHCEEQAIIELGDGKDRVIN